MRKVYSCAHRLVLQCLEAELQTIQDEFDRHKAQFRCKCCETRYSLSKKLTNSYVYKSIYLCIWLFVIISNLFMSSFVILFIVTSLRKKLSIVIYLYFHIIYIYRFNIRVYFVIPMYYNIDLSHKRLCSKKCGLH